MTLVAIRRQASAVADKMRAIMSVEQYVSRSRVAYFYIHMRDLESRQIARPFKLPRESRVTCGISPGRGGLSPSKIGHPF